MDVDGVVYDTVCPNTSILSLEGSVFTGLVTAPAEWASKFWWQSISVLGCRWHVVWFPDPSFMGGGLGTKLGGMQVDDPAEAGPFSS